MTLPNWFRKRVRFPALWARDVLRDVATGIDRATVPNFDPDTFRLLREEFGEPDFDLPADESEKAE